MSLTISNRQCRVRRASLRLLALLIYMMQQVPMLLISTLERMLTFSISTLERISTSLISTLEQMPLY